MKLTAKGRYAVMAMSDIASQEGNMPVSLSEISVRQNISITYLEQIFGQLRKSGLVESSRGINGGYVLAKTAKDVTLSAIISAVNEDVRAHGCTPAAKKSCTGGSEKCLSHGLWGALESHIGEFLESVTVYDVITGRFNAADVEAAQ